MKKAIQKKNSNNQSTMFSSWKKILRYSQKWLPAIIFAVVCAVVGTVLTLIGPNKIQDLIEIISEGFLTGIDMFPKLPVAIYES